MYLREIMGQFKDAEERLEINAGEKEKLQEESKRNQVAGGESSARGG